MPRPHAYCVIEISDLDPTMVREELAARPSHGVGLSHVLGASCAYGNLDVRGPGLLGAARGVTLPPVGTRLVAARCNLAAVAASAWLDLRATKGEKPGRGRYHDLTCSLRHGGDLCAKLKGDDLSSFEDEHPSLVRAALCGPAHEQRLPLRYPVDTVGTHLRRETFIGQPHASARRHARMARLNGRDLEPDLVGA